MITMERTKLSERVDDFSAYLTSRQTSPHTCRAYASDIAHFFSFWKTLEERSEQPCTLKVALQRYRTFLVNEKSPASTLARKLSCFNTFIRFITPSGEKPPFTLTRPHVKLPALKTITVAQLTYLLDELPLEKLPTQTPHRDKCIIELLYATGLRCSEIIALKLRDLSLTNRAIAVSGRGRKSRTVFFGKKAGEQLSNYLNLERVAPKNDSEFLFLNYRNQPLTARSIQRICVFFGQFLEDGTEITPQILRHSFAVHLLEQGANVATVQQLLGHAVRISTERYVR